MLLTLHSPQSVQGKGPVCHSLSWGIQALALHRICCVILGKALVLSASSSIHERISSESMNLQEAHSGPDLHLTRCVILKTKVIKPSLVSRSQSPICGGGERGLVVAAHSPGFCSRKSGFDVA